MRLDSDISCLQCTHFALSCREMNLRVLLILVCMLARSRIDSLIVKVNKDAISIGRQNWCDLPSSVAGMQVSHPL
jgi:hypothetical protein